MSIVTDIKWQRKYMRLAKFFAEDQPTCLSGRLVGAVVVDSWNNSVIGSGYNGPPKGTPHCGTEDYFDEYIKPELVKGSYDMSHLFIEQPQNAHELFKDRCPRRVLNLESGDGLELCSCEHAEKNAIYNCQQKGTNMVMFCWCGVPCWDCAKAIINFGIDTVVCLEKDAHYSQHSLQLLIDASVDVIFVTEKDMLNDTE